MNIIDCDTSTQVPRSDCVIALGNFDGIHLGHQALIQKARQIGDEAHIDVAVLLFKTHTHEVLASSDKRYLSSTEDKLKRLRQLGVNRVYLKAFDAAFAQTPPDDFLRHVLVGDLRARHVVAGDDYTFGQGARGTVLDLREAEREGLLGVHIEEYVRYDGERISSTRIRGAVMAGEVEAARAMMGKAYHLTGIIGHGAHRGHDLGYATANLNVSFPYVLPGEGVYLTASHVEDQLFYGMTSVGNNPTFTDVEEVRIEANLFDFEGDLYDQPMQLDFLRYERPNVKFDSPEALRAQLVVDERRLRAWAEEERLEAHQGI